MYVKEYPITVGVAGLGLIGGSLAKALKQFTSNWVLGYDTDPTTCRMALAEHAVDEMPEDSALGRCDLVFLALCPRQAVAFLQERVQYLRPGTVVMDLCGVKRYPFRHLGELCHSHNLCYVGGHPMAGKECWGYENADPELFRGASMIVTPGPQTPPTVLQWLEALFLQLGFGRVTPSDPEEHDRIIAFTSQLAHVVSSAYVKSPQALRQMGFSAGSFKDLTRVARLNPAMWTELFLENADDLTQEIDTIIAHLQEYREAIAAGDAQRLAKLLEDGRQRKEATL